MKQQTQLFGTKSQYPCSLKSSRSFTKIVEDSECGLAMFVSFFSCALSSEMSVYFHYIRGGNTLQIDIVPAIDSAPRVVRISIFD